MSASVIEDKLVVAGLEFKCPFCGGMVRTSTQANGGSFDGVMHNYPLCDPFEKLEPDEYLSMVRQTLEGTKT